MTRQTLVLVGTLAWGCGGVRVADQPLAAGLEWPPGEPRVRLERVVEARPGSRGARALLGGENGRAALFVRPFGVAWSGQDLLVADPGARRLVRVDPAGRVTLSEADVAGGALGLAACPAGIVASDPEAGRVALLDERLKRLRWLAEGLARPTGLACDDDGVYVAETGTHRVVVLGWDGTRRELGQRGSEPGQFNFPTAITLSAGELLVGDTLNFRVQRLALPDGRFVASFGRLGDSTGDMPRLKGLAVDAAGQVWVSDAHRDSVSLYALDGSLLLDLGGRGAEPGRFSFPAGIASREDGRVAVVDSFNRRVQVFRLVPSAGVRP